MSFIVWIILGVIGGFVGSKIMNKAGAGLLMDIAIGIVGAVVGGVISSAVLGVGVSGFNISSILIAIAGSVLVLWVYHNVLKKR